MKHIQDQQKYFTQTARAMEWEREVKAWDWKTFLQQKPKKVFKASDLAAMVTHVQGDVGTIQMYDVQDTSDAVQKRVLKLLQNQGKHTKKSVFVQQGHAKSHIVIVIKQNAQVELHLDNPIFKHWVNIYVLVGKNTEVLINDTHIASDTFGAGSVFVDVGASACVKYHITNDSKQNYQSHYCFYVAKHSTLSLLQEVTPTQTQLHTNHVIHTGEQTKTNHTWILDAKKNAKVYGNLVNYHRAKHTVADVAVKAVGRDRAQVKIDGWIDIAKRAFDTNSYLQQDVLLLSEKATIKAVPNLEILNNDVVASHGATLGMVDEQQLAYLQARGLSKKKSEKMIVDGFLQAGRERFV